MSRMFRARVVRADGRAINVVQRRAHLSYCFTGCCCGRTERGYAAVPVGECMKFVADRLLVTGFGSTGGRFARDVREPHGSRSVARADDRPGAVVTLALPPSTGGRHG